MIFIFLKDYKNTQRKICNRDYVGPAEAKLFTIWPTKKSLPIPEIVLRKLSA